MYNNCASKCIDYNTYIIHYNSMYNSEYNKNVQEYFHWAEKPRRVSALSHNAERMARHWRGTMMAAVGAPEVITQLESAAKVLMVRNSALFL